MLEVASQQERIQRTYDWLDGLIRASLGEFPDFSCAYYNGDSDLTLEEAQQRKHEHVLEGIGFRPGMRVLDIGSGWGPLLNYIKQRGGHPVGITLSPAQANYTEQHGFKVYLKDWRDLDRRELGQFDGVVSIGAFEHFCNVEQFLAGQQDEIYKRYFSFVRSLLPDVGRHYLQTMTWGNPHPEYAKISLKAPKDSPEYIVAHLRNFFEAGGWLPDGVEHIMRNAQGFQLISENSGRLDYLQTFEAWTTHFNRAMLRKPWIVAKLLPRLTDAHFRSKLSSVWHGAQGKAFEYRVFDHRRMVLEKL